MKLSTLFFGHIEFPESEEYREFQYKFLMVLLAFGALATLVFIVASGDQSALPMPAEHMRSMKIFTAACVVLWVLLRGRKQWFIPVAWAFEIASLAELASAIMYVPGDELRIIWLFTNIPGTYLLLGRRVGALMTVVIIIGLLLGNPHLSSPYSPNAVATGVTAMIYFAAFFHAYASRLFSFFTRMRDSNEQLRFMATRDALTGVLNARAYYEVCDRMIRVAKRNREPYAVLFVDLDHFKSINDTFGHAAGDHVLKSVADCLTGNIRHSDALGRIGGEEFSIFLPNTDINGATELAEHIRVSIEALMPDLGTDLRKITASIGVARNQHSDQLMLDIQRQADQAMYKAKAGGRNRVSSFDEVNAQATA
ncbi:MAG: GGDEF domain-containing protein [Oxalobacteraceae bacterium]